MPLAHGLGRRRGREPRVRRPPPPANPNPSRKGGFVSHRLIVVVAALVAALLIVPAAYAVKVHVRVEGKERTIFGPTAPLIDVTSPRANPLPENALDALESASVLGEFYYHVTSSPDVRVDQIGRIAEFGQTSWAYKVNGAAPGVGAAEYRLRPGVS